MILVKKEMDYVKFLSTKRTTIKVLLKTNLKKTYTIFDLKFNELDQTFSFKRSIRVNGFRINTKKIWTGSYEVNVDDDEKNAQLIIHIDTKKEDHA